MARVALIKEEEHLELSGLVEKLRAGRRGRLLSIYRTLLNAPALAESWFNHSNAVRWNTTLDGRLREILIIRIGHLTQCEYVLRQHVPTSALSVTVPTFSAHKTPKFLALSRFRPVLSGHGVTVADSRFRYPHRG